MASAMHPAMRPWEGVMQTLTVLSAMDDSLNKPESKAVLFETLEFMCQEGTQQTPSPRQWDTLVNTKKVPEVAVRVLGTLIDQTRDDAAALALVDVLATLLDSAGDAGVLVKQAAPTRLAAAIAQQLESAGLFKHLPGLFEQAAEQLRGTSATAAVLRELRDGPGKGSRGKQELLSALQRSQQATLLYSKLHMLYPIEACPASWGPDVEAAAMDLAATLIAAINRWVDVLPVPASAAAAAGSSGGSGGSGTSASAASRAAEQPPWVMLAVVMDQACGAVAQCSRRRAVEMQGTPSAHWYKELLSKPQYLEALTAALVYFMTTHLAAQETQWGSEVAGSLLGSNGSSGSNASSSSSGQQQKGSSSKGKSSSSSSKKKKGSSSAAAGASSSSSSGQRQKASSNLWVTACQQAQRLPAVQQELLQLLGCGSGRAMLWAGLEANKVGKMSSADFISCIGVFHAYGVIVEGDAQATLGNLAHVPRTDATLRQLQQHHRLLLGLLLHFAVSLPRLDVRNNAESCLHICEATSKALQGAMLAHRRQVFGNTPPSATMNLAVVVNTPPGGQAPAQHCFEDMFEYIPTLKDLMHRLLCVARGTSRPTKNSSSSSSRTVSNDVLLPAVGSLEQIAGLLMAMGDPLFECPPAAASLTWRAPGARVNGPLGSIGTIGSIGSSSDGQQQHPQHPWQPYAAEAAALLESFVRLQSLPPELALHKEERHPFVLLAALCSAGDRELPNSLAAAAAAAGFGSPEQQHLIGLLLSLVKKAGTLGPAHQTDAEDCRLAAATAAAAFARSFATQAQQQQADSGQGGGVSVAHLLPWLVLFGRCVCQWLQLLRWRFKGVDGWPAATDVYQEDVNPASVMGRLGFNSRANTADVFMQRDPGSADAGAPPLFVGLVKALQVPLQDTDISAQLAATAGVDVEALRQAAAAAVATLSYRPSSMEERQQHQDSVLEAVNELGLVLTALPISCACNSPWCVTLDGTSEAGLVKGRLHVCSACRGVRYCGSACQRKHWKQHKPVCKALQAAAVAVGGGACGGADDGDGGGGES